MLKQFAAMFIRYVFVSFIFIKSSELIIVYDYHINLSIVQQWN